MRWVSVKNLIRTGVGSVSGPSQCSGGRVGVAVRDLHWSPLGGGESWCEKKGGRFSKAESSVEKTLKPGALKRGGGWARQKKTPTKKKNPKMIVIKASLIRCAGVGVVQRVVGLTGSKKRGPSYKLQGNVGDTRVREAGQS